LENKVFDILVKFQFTAEQNRKCT